MKNQRCDIVKKLYYHSCLILRNMFQPVLELVLLYIFDHCRVISYNIIFMLVVAAQVKFLH